MTRMFACAALASLLAITTSCSQSTQEHARDKAAQAGDATRAEARKLSGEAKDEAWKLRRDINRAVNGPASENSASGASEKLHRGEQDLRVAGDRAAVKLSHAALIAKVKAKLAGNLGVSTLNNVDVDASGGVITLRGSVSSDAQRREAERAVSQTGGVSRVVNHLKVQP